MIIFSPPLTPPKSSLLHFSSDFLPSPSKKRNIKKTYKSGKDTNCLKQHQQNNTKIHAKPNKA